MNPTQKRWRGSALAIRYHSTSQLNSLTKLAGLAAMLATLLLAGCVAPIGADRVSTRQAYAQVDANALRTGNPSADTVAVLHRYDLDVLAKQKPDEAVRRLHKIALKTGGRDPLFALAELSYVAGERIRHSVKPWDAREPRDYYLGSAVYAWLFLFGQGQEAPPVFLDRRVREACDLYNYSLGLALTDGKDTNGIVRLQEERRRLPVGAIELTLDLAKFPTGLDQFEQFLLADQYRVRGLSVRNRQPGVGAPLLAVRKFDPELGISRCAPATAFLRLPASLGEVEAGTNSCSLEIHSPFVGGKVAIGNTELPLEIDLTTPMAYVLNQSFVWGVGMQQFMSPSKRVRSQLIPLSTFATNRIPVVFVHGTFASPVTWAELGNTLAADPVLRGRYQIWEFMYGSGNAVAISAGELRDALTATIQKLDPAGTNSKLHQMVVIGHSQGGLLTKFTATSTGDKIWKAISDKPLEEYPVAEDQREKLRHLLFVEPLPFVRRVIFISTPHHGSYLASSFARRFIARLMSLPRATLNATRDPLTFVKGSTAEKLLGGRFPTSLDSMSPKNPAMLALAEIPVAPNIKAHSIIPVLGDGDVSKGRDGVVAYQSAHVDYVESELVVHGGHSCQNLPSTIEEVRRILYEHLNQIDSEQNGRPKQGLGTATMNE
jgi:pimeloyl-ACP methyl ester carboxylesterase